MVWSLSPRRRESTPTDHSAGLDAMSLPAEFLAPLLSGAYARGVSDTLDLMGMPAVFLDRDGRVLSFNTLAGSRLGTGLRIEASHLVAGSTDDNAILSGLLAEAMGGRTPTAAGLSAALSVESLTLHAVTFCDCPPHDGELLGIILVLDAGADEQLSQLVRRIADMTPWKGRVLAST